MLLLLETSTDVCSVAISDMEGAVLAHRELRECLQHTVYLTNMVAACLETAGVVYSDLKAIAVSKGPGSYTSLRTGISTAKGYCFALNIPLISVSTLDALAQASRVQYDNDHPEAARIFAIPMIDARRNEVYTKIIAPDGREILEESPAILENNLFLNNLEKNGFEKNRDRAVFSGNGACKAQNVLFFEGTVFSPVLHTSAVFLAKIAANKFYKSDFVDFIYFEPTYLKPPNITTPKATHF